MEQEVCSPLSTARRKNVYISPVFRFSAGTKDQTRLGEKEQQSIEEGRRNEGLCPASRPALAREREKRSRPTPLRADARRGRGPATEMRRPPKHGQLRTGDSRCIAGSPGRLSTRCGPRPAGGGQCSRDCADVELRHAAVAGRVRHPSSVASVGQSVLLGPEVLDDWQPQAVGFSGQLQPVSANWRARRAGLPSSVPPQ